MGIDTTKSWTPKELKDVKIFIPETVVKDTKGNVVNWLSTKQRDE